MAKVIEFQNKDEKQTKQNIEMAINHKIDDYIDKGHIAAKYRNVLSKEIYSKVQRFARQFLENSTFPMPYHSTGDEDIDIRSEALATQAGEELNRKFIQMFAHSMLKVVELELQLWMKDKALNEACETL